MMEPPSPEDLARGNERVNVHGMDVSRWRCPECHRGLTWSACNLHGPLLPSQILDIKEDREAQITACRIRLRKILSSKALYIENPIKVANTLQFTKWLTIAALKDIRSEYDQETLQELGR